MKTRICVLLLATLSLANFVAAGKVTDKSVAEAFSKVKDYAEYIQKVDKAKDSGKSDYDSYKGLTDSDKGAQPDYNPPGGPQVPTDCPDGSKPCFAAAYEKLNRCRANLERLRAIRVSTEEFITSSLSFGDDVSAIHGVAGLAWQAERRKIEASRKNFKEAYQKKYQELMGTLQQTLMEVSQCEKDGYDESDWFNRYGFMYYQFMESRYAW